jgi:death on curing protein
MYIYPSIHECLAIHDEIIRTSGGGSGVIDISLLESTLAHIQNDVYYPEFLDKLTHLCYSVNKSHCFVDGNKRSSIAISESLLYSNSYEYSLEYFAAMMEDVAIGVAANIIDKDDLKLFLNNILEGYEYNESQKLMIIKVKQIELE